MPEPAICSQDAIKSVRGTAEQFENFGVEGRGHEHLDRIIHHSTDRVAGRVYSLSRGQRVDTPATDLRGHLLDFALRFGQTDCLSARTTVNLA